MPDARVRAEVRIEPMTPSDWPAVREIYAAGIATGDATLEPAVPDWATWDTAHRGEHRLVARTPDGRVLAWTAVASVSNRRVYAGVVEESIYVATDAQGQGIGRALLEALIASTEAAGIWTIQTGILAENAASLALHERVGFRKIGLRERLGRDSHGRWRDVWLMERRSTRVG
jgi:L-amino acid N-acyltransferase YncA